jgi:methylated-DNA-[protein]-cysteine S-methyltransferase
MVSTMNRQESTLRRRPVVAGSESPTSIVAFETTLNWMALAWRDDVLEGVAFGYTSRRSAEVALAQRPSRPQRGFQIIRSEPGDVPKWVRELMDSLQRFAEGEPVNFANVKLDEDHLTSFGRHVVAACRRIGWGQTRSYGDLAAECGSPGAARAVGSVMARNRFPLIVPCHRVLASGGELGGYSAPDGLKMKRRLLAMEGAGQF